MRRWKFDERQARLVSEDGVATLTPKAADVLTVLLHRHGELVSREEILNRVWGNISVTPDLVREYIFDLRSALGDDAGAPRYIETVRGRGFRLVGEVSFQKPPETPPSIPWQTPAIAVLQLDCFSEEPHWQLYADGLAEDLTTDLARFPELSVVARHSAFSVDKSADAVTIAASLSAAYLVEGSLSPRDDRLAIRFQLIDGASGRHVWVKRVEEPIDRLPAISGDLSAAIANAIGGWGGEVRRIETRRLTRAPAQTLSAYEHYLLCIEHEHRLDEASLTTALEHAEKSIALDPSFARARYARYLILSNFNSVHGRPLSPETVALIEAEVDRAYALDPHDPMILVAYGRMQARAGNRLEANRLLLRAADLSFNQADPSAFCASAFATIVGDGEGARSSLARAFALNPTPPRWYRFAQCRVLFFGGDFEACMAAARSTKGVLSGELFGVLAMAMLPDIDRALAAYADFRERFANFDFEATASAMPIAAPEALALYREAAGRLTAAAGEG